LSPDEGNSGLDAGNSGLDAGIPQAGTEQSGNNESNLDSAATTAMVKGSDPAGDGAGGADAAAPKEGGPEANSSTPRPAPREQSFARLCDSVCTSAG
jgi:hypothetical protein